MKKILLVSVPLFASLPAFAQIATPVPRFHAMKPLSTPSAIAPVRAIAPGRLNLGLDWSRRPATAGDVTVAMEVDDHGNVASATIQQSSGDPDWDQACLDAVRHASPLPAPFGGTGPHRSTLTIRAPHASPETVNTTEPSVSQLLASHPELSTHTHITTSPTITVEQRSRFQPPPMNAQLPSAPWSVIGVSP